MNCVLLRSGRIITHSHTSCDTVIYQRNTLDKVVVRKRISNVVSGKGGKPGMMPKVRIKTERNLF